METLKTLKYAVVRSRHDPVTGEEYRREIVGAFHSWKNAENYIKHLIRIDAHGNTYTLQKVSETQFDALKDFEDPQAGILLRSEFKENYFEMEEWDTD